MEYSLDLWIEYILRFSHLVAGIAWIGSSFYFIWLDSSFVPPIEPRHNVEGEVFMVHGGFYYQVEKKKIYPGEIPDVLHWFKWEATLTWATGFLLLIFLYFLNGARLLVDQQIYEMGQFAAIGMSLLAIAGSWLIYDFLWNDRFIKSKAASLISSVIFFLVLIYGVTQIFSGRGAFILVGAIFGSLMLLNVWVRILPGQSKMLKEAQAGQVPDYSVSVKSKVRSVHNTYFTFPVLFIMISNHYPAVYNHPNNWLLLVLIGVSGALVRHAMVTKVLAQRWVLFPAAVGLLALIMLTAKSNENKGLGQSEVPVDFEANIMPIVSARCISCHSSSNTDKVFKVAPKGVIFESREQILSVRDKVIMQLENKIMPLGNTTKMTETERSQMLSWLRQN